MLSFQPRPANDAQFTNAASKGNNTYNANRETEHNAQMARYWTFANATRNANNTYSRGADLNARLAPVQQPAPGFGVNTYDANREAQFNGLMARHTQQFSLMRPASPGFHNPYYRVGPSTGRLIHPVDSPIWRELSTQHEVRMLGGDAYAHYLRKTLYQGRVTDMVIYNILATWGDYLHALNNSANTPPRGCFDGHFWMVIGLTDIIVREIQAQIQANIQADTNIWAIQPFKFAVNPRTGIALSTPATEARRVFAFLMKHGFGSYLSDIASKKKLYHPGASPFEFHTGSNGCKAVVAENNDTKFLGFIHENEDFINQPAQEPRRAIAQQQADKAHSEEEGLTDTTSEEQADEAQSERESRTDTTSQEQADEAQPLKVPNNPAAPEQANEAQPEPDPIQTVNQEQATEAQPCLGQTWQENRQKCSYSQGDSRSNVDRWVQSQVDQVEALAYEEDETRHDAVWSTIIQKANEGREVLVWVDDRGIGRSEPGFLVESGNMVPEPSPVGNLAERSKELQERYIARRDWYRNQYLDNLCRTASVQVYIAELEKTAETQAECRRLNAKVYKIWLQNQEEFKVFKSDRWEPDWYLDCPDQQSELLFFGDDEDPLGPYLAEL